VLVAEMGYSWSELRDEYLADVLYTYAIWEKKQKEEQDKIEKQKRKHG
jgi:hypothetical protein